MNGFRTTILLAVLFALFMWAGSALGGQQGMVIAFVMASVGSFFSYWFSDKMVIAMYRGQEITANDDPELYGIVQDLAQQAHIPMPRVYIIPQETPNAFATGRNPQHAAVAVTEGIMRLLDRDELAGVLAHELGHVHNRDTLTMTVAATLAGALSHIANMAMWGAMLGGGSSRDDEGGNPIAGLLGIVMAPLAATLIQMAISRSREFAADAHGAHLSANPLALASALRKIEAWSQRIPMTAGSPATAHLFIINPFSGKGLVRLFSTHPSTEERIARLQALAREGIGRPR